MLSEAFEAVFQSMDAVAARARRMRVQSPRPMVPTEVFTANLVDMLVGAVTVAPSARTLAALEETLDDLASEWADTPEDEESLIWGE